VRALELSNVGLVRDHTVILDDISWVVSEGERWIVLGANGSGKTSLIRIASLYLHPSSGQVDVLGQRLVASTFAVIAGASAWCSASFADLLRPGLTATEIVMTPSTPRSSRGGTSTTTTTAPEPSSSSTDSGVGTWPSIRLRRSRRANANSVQLART